MVHTTLTNSPLSLHPPSLCLSTLTPTHNSSIWATTCLCCHHNFLSCPSKKAKSDSSLREKVHPLTLEELKALPHLVRRVSKKGLRGCRAFQVLRGHRVRWVLLDKGSQDCQEHQVPLVYRDTREWENLEYLDSQENLGVLDCLDQKENLVLVVAKDPRGLQGHGGYQAHLDYQALPNQEGRAYQASLGYSENPVRKASLDCLVLKAPKER